MKYRCKLFKVIVLLGHNPKKGWEKAPDAVRVVIGCNCVHASIRARQVLKGVKSIVSVTPISILKRKLGSI
jgi:hypothetical protein